MAPLSLKKYSGISKSDFVLKDKSVTLNFELSYNERTLIISLYRYVIIDNLIILTILCSSYTCMDSGQLG